MVRRSLDHFLIISPCLKSDDKKLSTTFTLSDPSFIIPIIESKNFLNYFFVSQNIMDIFLSADIDNIGQLSLSIVTLFMQDGLM